MNVYVFKNRELIISDLVLDLISYYTLICGRNPMERCFDP